MLNRRKIRVLLAEDHAIVREGLRRLLEEEADMEVVGEATDGRAAVEAAQRMNPDIVLIDLSMPELNGIEATRQITASRSGAKVICLSMHKEHTMIGAILSAGASGYLMKSSGSKELMEAIHIVATGGTFISPAVAGDVIEAYIRGRSEPEGGPFSRLTDRERQVLQMIAEGLTAKEIGSRLGIGQKTVLAHRSRIMQKLDLHGDVDLARYALQQGLVQL